MSVARHASVVGGSTALRRTAFLLLSGLFLGTPLCQPANAQEMPAERPPRVASYAAFVAEAAPRFGIPEACIRAVMRVESWGDVSAVSPRVRWALCSACPTRRPLCASVSAPAPPHYLRREHS